MMAVSVIHPATGLASEALLEKDCFETSVIALDSSRLRRKSVVSEAHSSLPSRSLPPIAMATGSRDRISSGDEVRAGMTRRVSALYGTSVLSQKYQNYRHLAVSEVADNRESKPEHDYDSGDRSFIPADHDPTARGQSASTAEDSELPITFPGMTLSKRVSIADESDAAPDLQPFRNRPSSQPLLRQRRSSLKTVKKSSASRKTPSVEFDKVRIGVEDGRADNTMAERTASRQRQPPTNISLSVRKSNHLAPGRCQSTMAIHPPNAYESEPGKTNARVRDGHCKSAPPLLQPTTHRQENLRPTHATFNFVYNDDEKRSEMIDKPIIGGLPTGKEAEEDEEDDVDLVDGLSDSFPVFSDGDEDGPEGGTSPTPITERALSSTGAETPHDRGLRILRWIMEEQGTPSSPKKETNAGKEPELKRANSRVRIEVQPPREDVTMVMKRSNSKSKLLAKT